MDPQLLEGIAASQRQASREILSRSETRSRNLLAAVDDAHAWFDGLRRKYRTIDHIACRAGCAWCCRQRIALAPPEAFRIAHFLDGPPFSASARATLIDTCASRWAAVDRLDSPRRFATGLPCPFLDTGGHRCVIHPVRPFACRWYESMDEAACRRPALANSADVDIPFDPRIQPLAEAVERGLLSALAERGTVNDRLVMTGALTILFQRRDALERWLGGENLFMAARVGTADMA